jgi:hypothetical protein
VVVAAGSDFHHMALAAGLGVGVVGVAPGVDVTAMSGHTLASIGSGASVKAADDVIVNANAAEDILMVGMGAGGGVVGVGGGVSVLAFDTETHASIAGNVTAGGDVGVTSADDTKVLTIDGGLAGGLVGVGASVGVLSITKDTQAFINDNATVNALGDGTGLGGVDTGALQGGDAADGITRSQRHGVVVQASSSENILHIAASSACPAPSPSPWSTATPWPGSATPTSTPPTTASTRARRRACT